jgi:hypothetical protein
MMSPIAVAAAETPTAATAAPVARRTRRVTPLAALTVLPRQVEYAYIRSDLRRLIIIAASLLALMLVILFLVER